MDIKISPSRLRGEIDIIPSKSHLVRLMLADFLSGGSAYEKYGCSDDIGVFSRCLGQMKEEYPSFDFGSSATAARVLIPVACALKKSFHATCSEQLGARPISELFSILRAHGVTVSSDSLPASFEGTLTKGHYEIPCDITSQYLSGFLFALPLLGGGCDISVSGNVSRPYTEMTLAVLNAYGIDMKSMRTDENMKYTSPLHGIQPEGDWSDGAFFLLANALGSDIKINGLRDDSVQGDKIFGRYAEIIKSGAENCVFDITDTPDLLAPLAVLACGKRGITRITGVSRLRFKESDRIVSVSEMINRLAGKKICMYGKDTFSICSDGFLRGGKVRSYSDHRIVMAAAVASVICRGDVTISGAEAVGKSYPSFFDEFNKLGGKAVVL